MIIILTEYKATLSGDHLEQCLRLTVVDHYTTNYNRIVTLPRQQHNM